MIKNDRQYRITKAAAARFADALGHFDSPTDDERAEVDPLIQRAERNALKSQLDDLQAQLREYEALIGGEIGVLELRSLSDLPLALVQARIAAGMSQKDLADRLGLKEQQVQRYEASNYQKASLARLLEVANALEINVNEELLLPSAGRSATSLFKRLGELGLSREFILSRLVPGTIAREVAQNDKEAIHRLVFAATNAVSHVFGWTPAAVLGEDRPWLSAGVLGAARFKVSENADQKAIEVYTFYAHYLALLLIQATRDLPQRPIPTDPDEVYRDVCETYGPMTFSNALRYCWDLGVPVLPLNDRGAFHGACWRVDGRNVIVLKQKTRSLARWLFDLLHELRHAGENPELPTHGVVEAAETAAERRDSDEEREASWFAGEASLGGQAEALAQRCVTRAQGSIERLKTVVPEIAKDADVETAVLANYMAFRLSLQGENWWGAATNLQPRGETPWAIARDVLLERADLALLKGMDRLLFTQALRDAED